MTVSQIFDKVRLLGRYDVQDVTNAQLFVLLNNGVEDQVRFVAGLREDFLLKAGTSQNLVSGTSDYTLATDILQLKKVEVALDGANFYVAARKDLNEITDLVNTTEISSSPKYTPITQTSATEFIIRISPSVTANVTNGLRYWYIARPAALSSTSEVPVTPPELHDALVQRMLSDLKQRDGNASEAEFALTRELQIHRDWKTQLGTRSIDKWEGFYAREFTE